jgi:uncharacterized membrane protein YccC
VNFLPDWVRAANAPDAPLSRANVSLNDSLEAESIVRDARNRLDDALERLDDAHYEAIKDGDTVNAKAIARVMNECAAEIEGVVS